MYEVYCHVDTFSYFVLKEVDAMSFDPTRELKACSQIAAIKLRDELNSGNTAMCRGSKKLGNACGICPKCRYTDS